MLVKMRFSAGGGVTVVMLPACTLCVSLCVHVHALNARLCVHLCSVRGPVCACTVCVCVCVRLRTLCVRLFARLFSCLSHKKMQKQVA